MKTIRRKLSAILCALVLVGILAPTASAAAPTFSDVPSSFWGASYIRKCASLGIVGGVGDGKFDPEGSVTFAQMVKMLCVAFYDEEEQAYEKAHREEMDMYYGNYFHWYSYRSYFFDKKGLLKHTYFNGSTSIDETATRAVDRGEMALLCANVLWDHGIKVTVEDMAIARLSIKDYGTFSSIYNEAVTTCYSLGVINGKNGGNFDAKGTMTRAEACAVITRMLDVVAKGPTPEKPATPTTMPTITSSNIQDVPISHKYAVAINALWDGGIITAEDLDENGNFRPDDELHFSEQALMYIRMFKNVKPVNKLEDGYDYIRYLTKKDGQWVHVYLNYLLDTPAGAAAYGLSKYITGYLGDLSDIDKTDGPLTVQSMRSEVHSLVYYVTNTAPDAKWIPAYHGYGVPVTEFYGECGAYDTNLDKVRFTEQRDENNRVVREWGDQPITRGEWCQIIYNLGITQAGQLIAPENHGGVISG